MLTDPRRLARMLLEIPSFGNRKCEPQNDEVEQRTHNQYCATARTSTWSVSTGRCC